METETNNPIQESNTPASNSKTRFIVALFFLIPLVVLLLAYPQVNKFGKNGADKIVKIKKPFPDITILAKAAFVWDADKQREIYGKNEKNQLPLASLTKVMTALVALDGRDGSEKIKVTSDSIKQEGDSGLKNEEEWKLKDLIDFSLVSSSNDGIHAAASVIESQKSSLDRINLADGETQLFIESDHRNLIDLMNKKAKDISLSRTFYLNETGLDASENENGGYGSAEDMAKLFAYIIKNNPEVLEATAYDEIKLTSLNGASHTAKNTNEIVGAIPNLIASKTGHTDLSGGNLIVAFDSSLMKPIIISILGSTKEGRFEDARKIIEATMNYLADENL